MKPTMLVGIDSDLTPRETSIFKILAENLGIEVGTRYGEVRVVLIEAGGRNSHPSHVDIYISNRYAPALPRHKQHIFSDHYKLNQRYILSRVGRKNPDYYSQGGYASFAQLPSNKRFLAKPNGGARSLAQLTFDTFTKTGATFGEILRNVAIQATAWQVKQEPADKPKQPYSFACFGENSTLVTQKDLVYFNYLASEGMHYFPGYQHREGEAIERIGERNFFTEDLVEDVEEEYRAICVGDELILAYARSLIPTPGSVARPAGYQETLTAHRFKLEDLTDKFPGLKEWLTELHAEHQYPTWSVDLYKRKSGQWGAFEFSCEYSVADLTTKDQSDIYSRIVENWVEMDNKD